MILAIVLVSYFMIVLDNSIIFTGAAADRQLSGPVRRPSGDLWRDAGAMLAQTTMRLTAEFGERVDPSVITRVVTCCHAQLRGQGSAAAALPELVERLARADLVELLAGSGSTRRLSSLCGTRPPTNARTKASQSDRVHPDVAERSARTDRE